MDASAVAYLREVLAGTDWVERTRDLGRGLRATRSPGGLLIVGTPDEEPWHVTAHLADESRFTGLPQLEPTLVRWKAPRDAPAHLRVTLDRLAEIRRGETLFVVSEDPAPGALLERVDDARRRGGTILALNGGDPELENLAHDALAVRPEDRMLDFDGAQHLVSAAAGEISRTRPPGLAGVTDSYGLRRRLAGLLEKITGPHQ